MEKLVERLLKEYKERLSGKCLNDEEGAELKLEIIERSNQSLKGLTATERIKVIDRFLTIVVNPVSVFAVHPDSMMEEEAVSKGARYWFDGGSVFINEHDDGCRIEMSDILSNFMIFRSSDLGVEQLSTESFIHLLQTRRQTAFSKSAEFSVTCKCGTQIYLAKKQEPGEESTYFSGKGWYVDENGFEIALRAEHDQLMLECQNCGNECWTFT